MKELLAFIALIAAILISGSISWNLIEPDSFGGALVFLGLWSILSTLIRWILLLVLINIFEK